MPYVLYCVAESTAGYPAHSAGVDGAAVEFVDSSGLRCFYSFVEKVASDADTLKRQALEFHQVTHSLFKRAGIIPFRFPTVLPSVGAIADHLKARSDEYAAALRQFRDAVQMEIRLALSTPEVAETSSGTEYLKARSLRARKLQEAAESCRASIAKEVIDWRAEDSSHGVRCFVLVRREAATNVKQQLQQVGLDRTITAVLSGPWPATAFLPDFR